MTDTGQIPGEGLPEHAGMVEQPGIPAPDAYTFLDPSEQAPEDDDLLLMPAAQGAWSDGPAAPGDHPAQPAPQVPAQGRTAAGAHGTGPADHAAARTPAPAGAPAPAARRPLRRGPVEAPSYGANATGGVVRSLADRGPAGAPQAPAPARHAGPPVSGPEHIEVPADLGLLPGPQLGEIPPRGATPWAAQAPEPAIRPEAAVQAPEPTASAEAAVQAAEAVAQAAEPAVQIAEAVAQAEAAAPAEPVAPAAQEQEAAPEAAPLPEPAPVQEVAPAVQEPAPLQEPAAVPAPERPATAETVVPAPSEAAVAEPEAPRPGVEPAEIPAQAAVEAVAEEAAPRPTPEQPLAEQPLAEQPAAEQPTAEQPAAEQPTAEQPVAEQPVTEQPVAEQPAVPAQEPTPAPSVEEVARASSTESMGGQFVAVDGPVSEGTHAAPAPVAGPVPPEAEAEQPATAPEPVPAEPPFVEAAAARAAAVPQEAPAVAVAPDVRPEEAGTGPEIIETPEAVTPEAEAAPEAGPAEADAAPVAGAETTEPEAPAPADPQAETPQAEIPQAETPGAGTPDRPAPAPQAPAPATVEEPAGDTAGQPPKATAEQPSEAPVAPVEAPAGPVPAAHTAEDQDTQDAEPGEPGAAAAEDEVPLAPPAPGYDEAEREAVLRVMRERRDIRNGFRSDPIPHEVLLRVLEAAHTAPSVGHSQPWDFVVIRSAETRRSMHELAQRQREAYAKSLPKARAKQFKELKIEAILDTPVNIVVTADPTRGGRHTLGRHTQPQMAPYSSALAVENLWLAARAEGLGVGWVSFFDEREMVRALGLPEHLEVVAYLCVGYVDEFPEEPELMQAGWSKRRPLSWVVHEETYGRRALPGEAPHDLLQETIANIRPLDAKALGEAWERQKRMTKPAGALGMLEIISAQLSGLSRMCPPPIPEPAAVAIFAGDHGVHAQGVTAWPQEVTAQMVANFLGGGAVCNAFAAQVGAEVCVVDVGVATDLPASPGLLPRKVRPGTADFTTGPALTREEVLAAIEVGIETARDLVAAGNKALVTGEMGIANTTASAALICVYTGMDPAEVTGRGTGINDEMHARKVDVVRRALELHQPDPADPIGVLAAVGGLEHAAMAGFLLGGASLRTPVILDGVSAGASALVARAVAPEALAACVAGHRSAEPGHVAALNKLGLRPLVDLDLRLGEGTGALLALPIVQSAARAMHEVATFDAAGVTEK
ncbi:nicotinate-nucleotide--dimethylbenzimidazole phosphoribosyltransferase [Streptomyces halstedii]|uniref:Nicotinate-nucleotide--dimethylbenzimidazole phosphoribosyltransferase n=1 Tax=Streptomyces halstedii TaxID=1944 RepID=A0ABS6U0R5_STRHA|nr:nicotinate-nucleotide--dimethylbenzimidazole phosphoribosyltransferase [Streptomyces halstedii]MBV7673794.1 nicotinate-nucleotide--dimethylbenzimidazole phosphoribosyltransferase [Streptomyces halstedii]